MLQNLRKIFMKKIIKIYFIEEGRKEKGENEREENDLRRYITVSSLSLLYNIFCASFCLKIKILCGF